MPPFKPIRLDPNLGVIPPQPAPSAPAPTGSPRSLNPSQRLNPDVQVVSPQNQVAIWARQGMLLGTPLRQLFEQEVHEGRVPQEREQELAFAVNDYLREHRDADEKLPPTRRPYWDKVADAQLKAASTEWDVVRDAATRLKEQKP